jgi:succinate-acetate transporter protein
VSRRAAEVLEHEEEQAAVELDVEHDIGFPVLRDGGGHVLSLRRRPSLRKAKVSVGHSRRNLNCVSSDGRRHHEQTRIMLRPIGSGLPLGFFSFSIGMLLLGCQAIGWIPVSEQKDVGMLLISFVFPLELLATVFAFLARDTLGATTLGLFTTSWLALGWIQLSSPPGGTSIAVGVYLFGFATVVLLLALLSTMGKPFFSLLLSVACARMVLAGAYEVGAGKGVYHVSGGLGIALTALALYGGVALALEDARQRELLPLFRRGAAAASFEGLEAQLERLEAEPGVRQQL